MTIFDELRQIAKSRREHSVEMQKIAAEYDCVTRQQPYWALGGLLMGALIGIPFLLWVIYG